MSKYLELVLKTLKTRKEVSALGFSKEEIKSIASDIDGNLSLEEDTTDEDAANAVNTAIDAAVPFLKLAQKSSSRIIKKKMEELVPAPLEDEDDEDDDEEVNDDEPKQKPKQKVKQAQRKQNDGNEEIKKLLKSLNDKLDAQEQTIAELKGNTAKEKRRALVEALVKGKGSLERTIMRSFERSSFKDDDDFNQFLSDAKEDVKAYDKDFTDAGLDPLTRKPTPDSTDNDKPDNVEPMKDDEIDELASLI